MLTKILCSIIGFKAVIKDEDSMKDLYFHVTYVDRLIIELAGTLREIVFDWGLSPALITQRKCQLREHRPLNSINWLQFGFSFLFLYQLQQLCAFSSCRTQFSQLICLQLDPGGQTLARINLRWPLRRINWGRMARMGDDNHDDDGKKRRRWVAGISTLDCSTLK